MKFSFSERRLIGKNPEQPSSGSEKDRAEKIEEQTKSKLYELAESMGMNIAVVGIDRRERRRRRRRRVRESSEANVSEFRDPVDQFDEKFEQSKVLTELLRIDTTDVTEFDLSSRAALEDSKDIEVLKDMEKKTTEELASELQTINRDLREANRQYNQSESIVSDADKELFDVLDLAREELKRRRGTPEEYDSYKEKYLQKLEELRSKKSEQYARTAYALGNGNKKLGGELFQNPDADDTGDRLDELRNEANTLSASSPSLKRYIKKQGILREFGSILLLGKASEPVRTAAKEAVSALDGYISIISEGGGADVLSSTMNATIEQMSPAEKKQITTLVYSVMNGLVLDSADGTQYMLSQTASDNGEFRFEKKT